MKTTPTAWIVVLSVCLYRCLLSLGPLEFQHDYAQPMLQDFRQCCRIAYQQKGMLGVLGLWWPVFSEAVIGMLAEHVVILHHANGGIAAMLQNMRRAVTITFCAFVLFGLPWLFFYFLRDPLAVWNPAVRAHPEIDTVSSIIRDGGQIAFLMILLGGLPLLYIAIKEARVNKRNLFTLFLLKPRDVGIILMRSLLIACAFAIYSAVVTALVNHSFENILPPLLNLGSLLLGMTIFIFCAQLIITAIEQALAHSTFSTRMQSFIRIPMVLTTLGMLVALVASIVEDILLSREAPQLITTQEMILWTSLMAIATCLALFALWSGLHEQPTSSSSRA